MTPEQQKRVEEIRKHESAKYRFMHPDMHFLFEYIDQLTAENEALKESNHKLRNRDKLIDFLDSNKTNQREEVKE